ncbi:hypothetical protein EWM64_g10080 [Hericium alpestre]|uniref:ABC transporter domain-containing protein n=1 Tax=Hericium alpestre TaxID=135208 RepID=A0A4Y9ZH39_9AGAM|nr:hypothetical protein EWM64_g10080 [Hericium alpestre]
MRLWHPLALAWIALLETLVWVSIGSFHLVQVRSPINIVQPFGTAATWLYATIRPVIRPKPTPPYGLFTLYGVHLAVSVLGFVGMFYDKYVGCVPLPSGIVLLGHGLNLVAVGGLVAIVLGMPGTNTTLNEDDVWSLSPTLQSRPVFIKFSNTRRATLLRRLWAVNSFDLIPDAVLSFVGVIFNYTGPFFLKRILDAIDPPTESRANAYIYASLAFFCALAKGEAELQHRWFNHRACSRMRSELMASIYDKALKRRDFSGVADKGKGKERRVTEGGKAGLGADEHKASADVGKIMNLMAGDVNGVGALPCLRRCGIADLDVCANRSRRRFLLLLGWSAFAGLAVFIVCWPLSSIIARHSIRIQKGLMAARDKRMGVINELIGAVKFIKFFAWEDRWIQRVLAVREIELKWMIKARVNSILFSVLWSSAPTVVSVISFFTVVMQGNELTVSTAFTTGVAFGRIGTYLDEDEVEEQVSTLKKTRSGHAFSDRNIQKGFGIENRTLKWNRVEERKLGDRQNGNTQPARTSGPDENAETPSTTDIVSASEAGDHWFELRDISVMFPDGQLSVVTGPTASGKTALLMALLGELTTLNGRIIMSKDPSNVNEQGLMHSISYAAQSPWLRHQSIKDNILFGCPYDEKRYNQVIDCCALKPDLAVLEDGDETEIGARGVSLSGGQKARVALARAVYARTKFVLLDDPLSAVDSHTARFLYEKLLLGTLLAHRTVVLVTHHVELILPGTYYLVRMLDGRIDTQGVVGELRKHGILDKLTHDARQFS